MMTNLNFETIKSEIAFLQNMINRSLDKYLRYNKNYPSIIIKSMRYSLFAGGKRLRPLLSLFTAKLLKLKYKSVLPFACAIEMIHTYSLIHDDLPAMDNDDFRRGKLTSHKKFGEAIAILTGDALLNYAFEKMLQFTLKQKNNYQNYLKAIYEIATAAGINGMITGQVVDITSENKKISKDKLKFLHLHKTAALIRASVLCVAEIAGINNNKKNLLKDFGEKIGLAFQIMDDILDETGDERKMGKKLRKDKGKGKSTYPKIYGLSESKNIANNLILEAKEILSKIKGDKKGLLYIADYIVNRIK